MKNSWLNFVTCEHTFRIFLFACCKCTFRTPSYISQESPTTSWRFTASSSTQKWIWRRTGSRWWRTSCTTSARWRETTRWRAESRHASSTSETPWETTKYWWVSQRSTCIQYIQDIVLNHKVLVSVTEVSMHPVHPRHCGKPQSTGEYHRSQHVSSTSGTLGNPKVLVSITEVSVHPVHLRHWGTTKYWWVSQRSACVQYIQDTVGNHKVLVSITEVSVHPGHPRHRGKPQSTGEYYRGRHPNKLGDLSIPVHVSP